MTTRFPKTLAELAVTTNPSPVALLNRAAELADGAWAEAFRVAADEADTDLQWVPVPDTRDLDFHWVHYYNSCGPITECPCTFGAVLRAALNLVADQQMAAHSSEADSADPLSQKFIDNINSNPLARRAFGRLADAYKEGRL